MQCEKKSHDIANLTFHLYIYILYIYVHIYIDIHFIHIYVYTFYTVYYLIGKTHTHTHTINSQFYRKGVFKLQIFKNHDSCCHAQVSVCDGFKRKH